VEEELLRSRLFGGGVRKGIIPMLGGGLESPEGAPKKKVELSEEGGGKEFPPGEGKKKNDRGGEPKKKMEKKNRPSLTKGRGLIQSESGRNSFGKKFPRPEKGAL